MPPIIALLCPDRTLSSAWISKLGGPSVVTEDLTNPSSLLVVGLGSAFFHEEDHVAIIQHCLLHDIPVVGVGSGAALLCEALGGKVVWASESIKLGLNAIKEDEMLVRLDRFAIETLPDRARVTRTWVGDGDVASFGVGGKDEGRQVAICFVGHPEIGPTELLEYWIDELDDRCELRTAEATAILESVRDDLDYEIVETALDGMINEVVGFLSTGCDTLFSLKRAGAEKQIVEEFEEDDRDRSIRASARLIQSLNHEIDDLRNEKNVLKKEVERLKRENQELRSAAAANGDDSKSPTVQQNTADAEDADATRIRALMNGLPLATPLEEILRMEIVVRDTTVLPNITCSEITKITSGGHTLLCIAHSNEGHVLFGGADSVLKLVSRGSELKQESFMLNSPPVLISVRPNVIPSTVIVGTLSGSLYEFLLELDGNSSCLTNGKLIETPHHKKHITGITFDPSGRDCFASISRDGNLLFWNEARQVVRTFQFPIDKLAECCCSVMVDGEPYVVVSKRNDHRVALVSFDSFAQRGFSVNERKGDDHVSFTILAMRAFKNLPMIAAATDKSRIILFDVRTGARVKEFFGHDCDEYARPSLAWSLNGNWIACTSNPSDVYFFHVATGRKVKFQPHSASVRGVSFFQPPDRQELEFATCSFDKSMKLWRLD